MQIKRVQSEFAPTGHLPNERTLGEAVGRAEADRGIPFGHVPSEDT